MTQFNAGITLTNLAYSMLRKGYRKGVKMNSKWGSAPLIFIAVLLLNAPSGWCAKSSDTRQALKYKVTGDQYLKNGETLRAIEGYQKAVAIHPKSIATLFNLAIAYHSEKNIEGAIQALEKIVKLDPHDVEAHYNLACLWLYKKDLEKAKVHFEKAKSCCPPDSEFASLTWQGFEYVNELEGIDSATQALALFLLQVQQGLTPEPVAF